MTHGKKNTITYSKAYVYIKPELIKSDLYST
jgi:hypothetical protein